jgi:cell wall-associated NlpC family hydrolase
MRGDDVREAQRVLNGKNFLKGDYYVGKLDGEFGELCEQATRRAKYWLGYAETGKLKWSYPVYGDMLHDLLTGQRKLPPSYQKRRKARLAAKAKQPLRQKALARAIRELGTEERPAGSNVVKYSRWYGFTGAWCAMFTSWCYEQAGSKIISPADARWAYCPFVVANARAGQHHLTVTVDPKPGDLVVYRFGGSVWRHIGLFEKWTAKTSGKFSAIEGNTSVTSDDNGGKVMRRTRDTGDGVLFVHVGK